MPPGCGSWLAWGEGRLLPHRRVSAGIVLGVHLLAMLQSRFCNNMYARANPEVGRDSDGLLRLRWLASVLRRVQHHGLISVPSSDFTKHVTKLQDSCGRALQ
jgi:hypothetical protein